MKRTGRLTRGMEDSHGLSVFSVCALRPGRGIGLEFLPLARLAFDCADGGQRRIPRPAGAQSDCLSAFGRISAVGLRRACPPQTRMS